MSYNIDAIEILSSEGLSISRERLGELRVTCADDDLPECSIFDDDWPGFCCEERNGVLFPKLLWWAGDGSGSSADLFTDILREFSGSVDLLITWEGGDSFSGLRLCDGVVTRRAVKHALGDEVPR